MAYKYLLLPKKLHDEIESINFTRINKNHVYRFVNHLYYLNHISTEEHFMNAFVDIPSSELRKYFTKDYFQKFMKALTDKKIIIRSPYFSTNAADKFKGTSYTKNKPFGYKINENLFDFSELVFIDFDRKMTTPKSKQQKGVIKDLNRLKIDVEGMIKFISNYSIDDEIKVVDDLDDEIVELNVKGKYGENKVLILKSSDALAYAINRNKDLILYKNKYYLGKLNDFKRVKLNNFRASQLYSIAALNNQDYYASISSTNGRLNSTITNLKSEFISNGYITLDGEKLIDIDLSNSQPCLLSYFLSDTNKACETFPLLGKEYQIPKFESTSTTFNLFNEMSGNGQIYEYISEKTGMDRQTAKMLFLKTLFSKPKYARTKMLKELFPDVFDWINQFKEDNGCHKKMAIMLQKLESEIFIKHIYKTLKDEKYIVYTKHDSIVCKESEADEIRARVESVLDGFGIEHRLK